jgi:hypothetical protein
MFSLERKTRSKRFTDVRNDFMELFVICFNEGRKVKKIRIFFKKIKKIRERVTPMMSFVLSSGRKLK